MDSRLGTDLVTMFDDFTPIIHTHLRLGFGLGAFLFSLRIFCTRIAHALKKARHIKRLTCGFSWSAGQDLNLRPTNIYFPPGQTLAHACTFCHRVFAAQSAKHENDVASRLIRLHIFCTRRALLPCTRDGVSDLRQVIVDVDFRGFDG